MNIEAQGTRINDFIISPNPVRDISYLIIKPSEQQILTIKIFNSTGTFIEEHQVKSPAKIKIHSSDYPTGIYFYQVIKEGKSIYNSKFIVL